ncbi:hypothetical protein BH20ACI3_BH20ACI3_00890 [soil metagenome]
MVKGEPNTPAMVVKGDWKRDGNYEENDQNELIVGIYNRKRSNVGEQNYQLGSDHVYQDGADKEALFALKDHGARRATAPYSERRLEDRRLATRRTTKEETPAQQIPKWWAIPHEQARRR